MPPRPGATYRLQFTPAFGFEHARAIVPYLRDLGITHVYASPIFRARPGSEHGYDVVDPTQINPELGGREALDGLVDSLRSAGLGLLLDIVPNHMAAHADNRWWWDVLARGRESAYADWFDIDWSAWRDRIVLPVLGADLAEVLERGELRLVESAGMGEIHYFTQRFPVREGSGGGRVDAVLERQHYTLVNWREGPVRINYRRFFDVTELVGVRPEVPEAFARWHATVLDLVGSGAVSGLRIDHIDGLANPGAYLERLHAEILRRGREPFIIVEKILAPGETIPAGWPVAGTTGYDAMNLLNALWVDRQGCERIFEHARGALDAHSFEEEVRRCKQMVIERLFPGDLRRLAGLAGPLLGLPVAAAGGAIAALTAALPVYRTYISAGAVSEQDRGRVQQALRRAYAGQPLAASALGALANLILNPPASGPGAEFITRWQQFTGPVMAKGAEDTAMYRTVALTSLNEVGGEAAPPRDAIGSFHSACARIAGAGGGTLNATSTHDTKRSEDVRCRISAISELAQEWPAALQSWTADAAGERHRGPAPSARDQVLLYQAILGAWPAAGDPGPGFTERIVAYARKAAREAKLRTSWTDPDEGYEQTLEAFVRAVLDPRNSTFREESEPLRRRITAMGAMNSLAQTALKLTMPGIPDTYQGCEVWDLSLVDPDNRRPVDYPARAAMLREVGGRDRGLLPELMRNWPDGRIKLYLTTRLLRERREHPQLFAAGEYIALEVTGEFSSRIVAFARRACERWSLTVAMRAPAGFVRDGSWLPGVELHSARIGIPEQGPREWRNTMTGEVVSLRRDASAGMLLEDAPFAVLVSG